MPLSVKAFSSHLMQENCYVVSDDATRQAVIIDCGAYFPEEHRQIQQYLADEQLVPLHHLLTHGHFDHIFGVPFLHRTYQLKPEAHAADHFLLEDADRQTFQLLGMPFPEAMPPLGEALTPQRVITLGTASDATLHIIHTPGHSPGSVVIHCPEARLAFTGDTLFRMSVGRTDLEGGSQAQLMASLRTLAQVLPPDTQVLPGHGPATTMSQELRSNPYLQI